MYHVLFTLISSLCIYFSCMNLLPEKLNLQVKILIIVLISIFSFFLNDLGQLPVLIIIFCMLFIIYCFSKNKWLNLSCVLFGYIFSITLNYLCIWLAQYIFNMNLYQIYQSKKITLLISLLFCVFCYLTTKMLSYYINHRLNINNLLTDSNLNFYIFLSLLFISVVYILNFSYGEKLGYSYSIITFSGILFLLLFISIVFLMKQIYNNAYKIEETKHKIEEYDRLQSYTNDLEKLYNSMRQFKHDYINILATLSAYINQENYSDLNEYFQSEILPTSHDFTLSDTKLGALANVKITALKSLLSSKLIYSMERGIITEIELPDSVDKIPIDTIQFIRILGIFLDNAIEAALESNEKIICLCIAQKENSLLVIVKNSSKPLVHNLADLTGFGISSKGSMRGIGLNNVKSILDSYQNVTWDMEYIEPFFIQQLTLFYQ